MKLSMAVVACGLTIAGIAHGQVIFPVDLDPYPSVQVTLSTSAAATVQPHAAIPWSLSAQVLAIGTFGLSCVGTTLTQTAGPAGVSLQPATTVPAAMAAFDRPRGFANTGPGGTGSGFGGTPISNAFGGSDLLGVGGCQNNSGVTLPVGGGVATDANVVSGVAVGGSQQVAAGSFFAPLKVGTYTVRLSSPVANVFVQINAPPSRSPVTPAGVTSTGMIQFTVACGADFNGNHSVTVQDLFDYLAAWFAHAASADFNGSGTVTVQDLFDYLGAFFTGCQF